MDNVCKQNLKDLLEVMTAVDEMTDHPERIKITLCDRYGDDKFLLNDFISQDTIGEVVDVLSTGMSNRQAVLLEVVKKRL